MELTQYIELCYGQLNDALEEVSTPNKIRFMIQDLVELRENDWVSRRQRKNPFHFTASNSNANTL